MSTDHFFRKDGLPPFPMSDSQNLKSSSESWTITVKRVGGTWFAAAHLLKKDGASSFLVSDTDLTHLLMRLGTAMAGLTTSQTTPEPA